MVVWGVIISLYFVIVEVVLKFFVPALYNSAYRQSPSAWTRLKLTDQTFIRSVIASVHIVFVQKLYACILVAIFQVLFLKKWRGKIIGTVLCWVVYDSCSQWCTHRNEQFL